MYLLKLWYNYKSKTTENKAVKIHTNKLSKYCNRVLTLLLASNRLDCIKRLVNNVSGIDLNNQVKNYPMPKLPPLRPNPS